MSGIYIKNMEMPKGCATCPYCDRAWSKPKCKAKSMRGRFMEQRLNLDRTRQKWCPLVPVPEHGRLGDLDELVEKFKTELTISPPQKIGNSTQITLCCAIGFDGVERIINIAPTIIPPSKEKESP